MLKLNKKLKIPLLLIMISCGGIFLYQYLTFIPEYSSATNTIETPVYDSNVDTPPTLLTVSYMSDLTPDVCGRTPTPNAFEEDGTTINANVPTKQLIDKRDGNRYWVSKLADGNCWMVQNLDYSIKAGQNIDSTNSNVTATWKPTTSEETQTTITSSWSTNSTAVQSWDPGKYINNRPDNRSTSCSDTNNLQNCTYATNVSNMEEATESMNEPIAGSKYDSHYLVGNYYSYMALTAKTNSNIANSGLASASGSICPKNWRLPVATNSAEDGSTWNLLNKYKFTVATGGHDTSFPDSNSNISKAPLYYIASGTVRGSNTIGSFGQNGYFASATGGYGRVRRLMLLGSTAIRPVGGIAGDDAYEGNSARCLVLGAKGLEPVYPPAPIIDNPTLSVTIPRVLTLDVTDSVNIETNPNNISTGTFTASVTSNANYNISLNATSEDASATSLVNIKDNKKIAEIPTITSTTQPTIGISSWGIRKCNNLTTETCTENYKPLPTKNSTTGNPFLTSTPGNHQHLFQIGIGIGPELPSGTYTTSITVTASQN